MATKEIEPQEQAYGQTLLSRLDAYGLLSTVLGEAEDRGDLCTWCGEDVENAWTELRALEEEAEEALRAFKRRHGI